MRYLIANFKKEIPVINGLSVVPSLSHYQVYKLTEEAWDLFPFDSVDWEEITELEGTQAVKYYGEVRGYRSAYSDVEGLTPDPDELAKGKRKTKVYITPEVEQATVTLMKRVFKKIVIDEFNNRESKQGQEEILAEIDDTSTIKEINYCRERLLGIEMPKSQLKELLLWDDNTNSRIGRMHFNLGF
jgi:hypothetical protein